MQATNRNICCWKRWLNCKASFSKQSYIPCAGTSQSHPQFHPRFCAVFHQKIWLHKTVYKFTIFCLWKVCCSSKMIQNKWTSTFHLQKTKMRILKKLSSKLRVRPWCVICILFCFDRSENWSASCICLRSVLGLISQSDERSKKKMAKAMDL